MVLAPWEHAILFITYGWKKADGTRRFRRFYLEIAKKNGKALALDTPIPTPSGMRTMADVHPGDYVFGVDGKPALVTLESENFLNHDCYEVEFSTGEKVIADADHLWETDARHITTSGRGTRKGVKNQDHTGVRTTVELFNTQYSQITAGYKTNNHRLPTAEPLQFPQKGFSVNPYVLGVWLGDGKSEGAGFESADLEIVGLVSLDEPVTFGYRESASASYSLSDGDRTQQARDKSCQARLRKLGVIGNKHIPEEYFSGSINQRLELLRGLMDTDGCICKKGECYFDNCNETLARGVARLAASLGFRPNIRSNPAKLYGRTVNTCWTVSFTPYHDELVFNLSRKGDRQQPRKTSSHTRRTIKRVTKVPSVPTKCIAVNSPRNLYLITESCIPTHNTGLAAALSLYHLIADVDPATGKPEKSPRVVVAATTREQAKECFLAAVAMRNNSSVLSKKINQSGKDDKAYALHTKPALGRLSMMTRDAKSQDGKLISTSILDELHRWETDGGLYPIIRYGGRTRKQPLMIELTTAGASAGGTTPCWKEHEYAIKVLTGFLTNDEFAPWIFSMDDKDNWEDPANWVKSNPSIGHLFPLDTIIKEYDEVQGKPSDLADFKRYALNIWSSASDDPAVDIDKWNACCIEPLDTHPDPRRMRDEFRKKLAGQTTFFGVDVAPKLDTSSLQLLFPPTEIGQKWRVLEFFWIPAANAAERRKRDKVAYDEWARDKFITLTPGNMTDMRFICDEIIKLSKEFNLKQGYYDPNYANELVRMLGETDYALHERFVPFKQGFPEMNAPCHEFERKVLSGEFQHANNPVMRWQVEGLVWSKKHGGETDKPMIRPDRDKKRRKIDGPVALIMALACATSPDNLIKPKRPFYVVTST